MHMRTPRLARFVIASLVLVMASSLAHAQKPAQTASEFYMKYRAAFDKAKTIDEILPYMAKENRAQAAATPAADRAKMFEMVKMMNKLTGVKILKEERTADGAMLTVEGIDEDKKKNSGKVSIVKEGGEWKLGKESWSSSAS
jgi:hypothetical protein